MNVFTFAGQMKKITLFILLSCYMLMTTGVVAVSHYCMNRLASVSLFTPSKKSCGKCGMQKEKHSCCNDKETLVKVDTDHHKAPLYLYELSDTGNLAILTTDFLLTQLFNGNKEPYIPIHAPPPPDNAIYLLNNVFRI